MHADLRTYKQQMFEMIRPTRNARTLAILRCADLAEVKHGEVLPANYKTKIRRYITDF